MNSFQGKIFSLAFYLIIHLGNFSFAQEYLHNYGGNWLIDTSLNFKVFENYLEQYSTDKFRMQESCLDTIIFEHKNEYFFLTQPPFAILTNGNFVISYVAEEPSIYLFNSDGRFIKTISRFGQGPGEIMPGKPIISTVNEHFYVVDPIEFKLSLFDLEGNFVRQINSSRKFAPVILKISPTSNHYYYYNSVYFEGKPMFTIGDLDKGIIKHCGYMEKINSAAKHAGDLKPLTVNEKGLLFVIKPEEYGYEVYSKEGDFLAKMTGPIPNFFQPVKEKDLKNAQERYQGMEFPTAYINNTRTEKIYYLGDNILVIIYVKLHFPGSNKKITLNALLKGMSLEKLMIRKNIEFWRADGILLGMIEMDDKIIFEHGENGKLYYWHVDDKQDENGVYPNPKLVVYDLFKQAGLRN